MPIEDRAHYQEEKVGYGSNFPYTTFNSLQGLQINCRISKGECFY